jgi:hypothetical protein
LTARNGERTWLALFVAGEVIALPLLFAAGHRGWFFNDDWDFLSARTAGNLGDLFRSHYDHWTMLPILAYRLLWWLVGIRSYSPYLLLLLALHLTAAALLRVVMRRAGVRPAIATLAALLLVAFGSGAENVLVAFQITFVGSLVFGLTQLLLADHDGPVDRRDGFGLLAGIAGLLCSGVAISMVIVVGLAVLRRRGWRVASLHTAPLAALYVVWHAVAPRGQSAGVFHANSPGTAVRFVGVGIGAALGDLGPLPGLGIAIGALLIAGLVVAGRARGRALVTKDGAPIAMLVGALVFLVMTGLFRSAEIGGLFFKGTGPEHARQSRYAYVVVCLMLPALALAADAIIRRWRVATVVVVALLLVGVPSNIRRFSQYDDRFTSIRVLREGILRAPRLARAGQLPRSLRLTAFGAPDLTLGWLIDGVASGRVPKPAPAPAVRSAIADATETLGLALAPGARITNQTCVSFAVPSTHLVRKADILAVEGAPLDVRYVATDGSRSLPRRLRAGNYVALAGPLQLVLAPIGARPAAGQICR